MASHAPAIASGSPTEWLTPTRFLVLLGLLVAASFPGVLLGLETFYYRDYGVLAYPTIYHHQQSFWRGEIPLWNPLSHCGVPFLAQWGTMVLYPLSLVNTLLPLPWSLGVFCLGHLWFGGIGLCLLASRWTRNQLGAAVAGFAYCFGGLTLSSLMWPNWTAALGWLPWVIYCGEQAGARGGRWIVYAAVAGTFQMLTGVPEVVLLTWFVVGVVSILEAIRSPQALGRGMVRGVAVIALVAALSAAQLLPFHDLVVNSQRQGDFVDPRWPMPAWGWANLIVPLFHCFATPQGSLVQHDQGFFTSYYPGLLVIVLALVPFRGSASVRRSILYFLLLLGMVLALGPHGYLYSFLKELLPGAGLGRYPVKFFVLGAFALPLLAAFGVASANGRLTVGAGTRSVAVWVTAAIVLLAGVALLRFGSHNPLPYDQWQLATRNFWIRALAMVTGIFLFHVWTASKEPRWRQIASLGVLLVVWADLRFHWPSQNPTLSAGVLAAGITQLDRASSPAEGRIYIAPWAEQQLLYSNVPDRSQDVLGKRLAMWSNLNLLEKMPKLGGAMTLRLRHQEEVQKRVEQLSDSNSLPVLDYLSVAYTTSPSNAVQWQPRPSALPWITAGQVPIFQRDSDSLEALVSSEFDPMREIILPAEARLGSDLPKADSSEVEVRRISSQHVRLILEADQPTWVSIAQSYHHAWRATSAGRALPVWRANHAFQAIQLSAGSHEVDLRYVDRRFMAGSICSVIALCAAGLALRGLRPREAPLS